MSNINITILLLSVSVGGPKEISFIINTDTNETVLSAKPGKQIL